MVQILLPQICSDAARATIVFLYTDVLPPSCLGESVEVGKQGEKQEEKVARNKGQQNRNRDRNRNKSLEKIEEEERIGRERRKGKKEEIGRAHV